MQVLSSVFSTLKALLIASACCSLALAHGQNSVNVRVMAANLNGNSQTYEPFALRILQGLKPDVVAIQEFNYSNNAATDFRAMVDTAFGTNFVYYREPHTANGDIPNGIISRYPILNAGTWTDTLVGNRGFAWAQIDVPGTNDLYLVSVHLLTSSAGNRATEANNLKALMQANFPAHAWVVVAGDFNAGSRTEACVTTWNGYLTDAPVPVDNLGNSDTSANRNSPHDYVLPSLPFSNFETATVCSSLTYSSGLVFDSRVYTANELTIFDPVQAADSGLAQHMAVMKDFLIPGDGTNVISMNPPAITAQPPSAGLAVGNSASIGVTATGTGPLNYQWRFNGANISGGTTNPLVLANVQLTSAGNYSVIITNTLGSVTSSNALLTVTNALPAVAIPPQNQFVLAGSPATFSVTVTGTLPLNYQWLLGGTNISGATTNPFTLANVQPTNAGSYSVVVTNVAGSVTSAVATLSLLFTNPAVFAQWNFNSVPPDASTSTGTTAPSVGSGMASLLGGITGSFVGGDTLLDPAGANDNTAWTTTTYPAATANNKGAGVQFSVSTAGKQNLSLSWSQRSSNTGGKYFRLQYSTNNGISFADYPTAVTVGTAFSAFTNSLAGVAGVNNNSNFVFRIVAEFESTATGAGGAAYVAANAPTNAYSTSGTSRFDMVTVSGTALLAAAPAVLTAPTFAAGQVGFSISGSAGLSYIVQTATNLGAANWISISTNVAPFAFGDTNLTGAEKFYRAVSQ